MISRSLSPAMKKRGQEYDLLYNRIGSEPGSGRKNMAPKQRKYALDRVPTPEEIREILDASDIRGKPLTLLFVSSGIREGALETLSVGDYTPIRNNGQIVAGRLVLYAGHPEQYVAFITFETCVALDNYLEFRKTSGENITNTSPLFRETFDPITSHEYNEKIVRSMTAHAIRQDYNRLLHSIGIRMIRDIIPVLYLCEAGKEQIYDKQKYRDMLVEAAETVLGYFGFDRTLFGDTSRSKNRKWWWHQLREQRQKDIDTEKSSNI